MSIDCDDTLKRLDQMTPKLIFICRNFVVDLNTPFTAIDINNDEK